VLVYTAPVSPFSHSLSQYASIRAFMVLFIAANRLYKEEKVGAFRPILSFLYPVAYFAKISAYAFPLISAYKGI
jgi:hypothetical protein